jgi:aspartyl aminopeptidase
MLCPQLAIHGDRDVQQQLAAKWEASLRPIWSVIPPAIHVNAGDQILGDIIRNLHVVSNSTGA